MPRNGSGAYSPPQNSWNPAINGMSALPNDWMAILNDMAAALQASIAADGQTPITGSLNFGNNRLRNVGAPQGQGDGLRFEQMMKGADIASATTIAFPIEGALFDVTGTTAITAIAGAFPGRMVLVRFKDVLTLTQGTNLQLPGGANVTTKAGDFAAFSCVDGTKWVCWLYPRPMQDQINLNTSDIANNTNRFMTFAQIDALTEDQGPIICTDQDGILYAWDAGQSEYVPQTADDATALAKSSRVNLLTPAGLGFSLQPEATGSATFTKTTNNIEFTSIVGTLSLEVGDVIQITGSADNDNLYTVESIVDADNIIVNYEHRNGAGSLSLTDETETVTIKRVAKWFAAPIGLGQAWISMLSSRSFDTIYVAPYPRGITVLISATANASGNNFSSLMSDGVEIAVIGAGTSHSARPSVSAHISTNYQFTSGTNTINQWAELR